MKLFIKDTDFAGKVLHKLELEFATKEISIRELIKNRVLKEVALYNSKKQETLEAYQSKYHPLVTPRQNERILNKKNEILNNEPLDGEKQVYIALEAFQKNEFFILVDDVQSELLDQKVLLSPESAISFIKLTPLVGG